jgi:hypothetical protein
MLSSPSIYPDQLFVNLLTDAAVAELVIASANAAVNEPENADVYNDLFSRLMQLVKSRFTL